MSKLIVLILLAVAVLALGWLVTGAGELEQVLPGGMPVGNALTAIALIAPALAAVLLSRTGSRCRQMAKLALAGAISWLPLSIALAGNVQLNFTGSRGSAWLVLSLLTLVAVMGSLAWAAAAALQSFGRGD
jgi:hypothetical protein